VCNSPFSETKIISGANGNYIKSKQFDYKDYEKFKEKQSSAYKKTDEYKETKAKLKKMVVLIIL
jgi:hypothetical protein